MRLPRLLLAAISLAGCATDPPTRAPAVGRVVHEEAPAALKPSPLASLARRLPSMHAADIRELVSAEGLRVCRVTRDEQGDHEACRVYARAEITERLFEAELAAPLFGLGEFPDFTAWCDDATAACHVAQRYQGQGADVDLALEPAGPRIATIATFYDATMGE